MPSRILQYLEPEGGLLHDKVGAGTEGAWKTGTLIFPQLLLGAVEEGQHVLQQLFPHVGTKQLHGE